jgi:hypothetical protein
VIFARAGLVMNWCGNMTTMESFGCFASNVIGGISVTLDQTKTYDKRGGPDST